MSDMEIYDGDDVRLEPVYPIGVYTTHYLIHNSKNKLKKRKPIKLGVTFVDSRNRKSELLVWKYVLDYSNKMGINDIIREEAARAVLSTLRINNELKAKAAALAAVWLAARARGFNIKYPDIERFIEEERMASLVQEYSMLLSQKFKAPHKTIVHNYVVELASHVNASTKAVNSAYELALKLARYMPLRHAIHFAVYIVFNLLGFPISREKINEIMRISRMRQTVALEVEVDVEDDNHEL